ncbi:MAG: hypothetical protein ISR99_01105 [Parcubacteria group bacterium]|nr:hypothetical protein [Parcubacteria group bacterium]
MKITGIIVLILVVVAGGYFLLANNEPEGVSIEAGVPVPGLTIVEEKIVNDANSANDSAPITDGAKEETTPQASTSDTPQTTAPEPTPTPDPEPTTPEVTEPETVAPKTVTINYSSSGYSPKDITISKGDTVRFVSASGTSNWPASAFHPTHTVYPGSNISKCGTSAKIFDACGVLADGEAFEFTFNEEGTWKYHNHVSSSRTGSVTVE